ncbi:something about silencing protein 10 [Savitreella phatthalungensis]
MARRKSSRGSTSAAAAAASSSAQSGFEDRNAGKRSAVRTYADVAGSDDEEIDAFEAKQDKILLDGTRRDNRMRGRTDDDAEFSDEEVMRIPGDDDSEDEDDEDDFQEDEDDDDEVEQEEDEDDLDPDQIERRRAQAEREGLEGWGDRKGEYYNNDNLEDDDELKAEEQEAIRIQKAALAKLDESAYAVDSLEGWRDGGVSDDEEEDMLIGQRSAQEDAFTKISQETLLTLPTDEQQRIFLTRHPEFEAFAAEFQRVSPSLQALEALQLARPNHPQLKLISLKSEAARSYLSVLAFYFYYLTQPAAREGPVREHEMMVTLVQCREAWNRVADLVIDENASDAESIQDVPVSSEVAVPTTSSSKKRKRPSTKHSDPLVNPPKHVSFAPVEESDDEDDIDATLASLRKIKDGRRVSKSKRTSDRGDAEADALDAEESQARKRSLRFHAAKIASKAGKRARVAAHSGDADVPYRERRKERELRMAAEAQRRASQGLGGAGGDDLDDVEPSRRTNHHDDDDLYDDNDYYTTVANAARDKKAARKADHDSERAAMRAERAGYKLAEIDGDGEAAKRKIGRDIATNKGTDAAKRRPKENRNARVKKRKRYEAAQKKLGSQKAIFKGSHTGSSYAGEKTGINARTVKSVRLDAGTTYKR